LEALKNYHWPGNVRELKNLIERLDIMTETDVIDNSDIPAPYNGTLTEKETDLYSLFSYGRLKDAKKAFEEAFVAHRLEYCDFDISETAKQAGVDKSYVKKVHKKIRPA
ncbi:MAG: sigma-54-dependent Fis family transcriptional regulator, partial [Thermodesulfobacteriota bacterium]